MACLLHLPVDHHLILLVSTGKYVRYGPNRLLVNTPQGLHGITSPDLRSCQTFPYYSIDIYDHSKNVKKANAYLPMVPSEGAWTVITTINKAQHHQKRKITSKILSSEALKSHEPDLLRYLADFCEKLRRGTAKSGWSNPKFMNDLCRVSKAFIFEFS